MGLLNDVSTAIKELREVAASDEVRSIIGSRRNSLSRKGTEGTLQFPNICSKALSIDHAIMINKALERQYAVFTQITLSLNPYLDLSKDKNVSSYLKKFHQNHKKGFLNTMGDLSLENSMMIMSNDDESIEAKFIVAEGTSANALRDHMDNLYCTMDYVNENCLNDLYTPKEPIVNFNNPDLNVFFNNRVIPSDYDMVTEAHNDNRNNKNKTDYAKLNYELNQKQFRHRQAQDNRGNAFNAQRINISRQQFDETRRQNAFNNKLNQDKFDYQQRQDAINNKLNQDKFDETRQQNAYNNALNEERLRETRRSNRANQKLNKSIHKETKRQNRFNNKLNQDKFDYQQQQDAINNKLNQDKFDYQQQQDAINNKLNQDKFDYQQRQDAINNKLNQDKFEETKRQNKVGNKLNQDKFDYQQRQDDINNQLNKAKFDYQQQQDAISNKLNQDKFEETKRQNRASNKYREDEMAMKNRHHRDDMSQKEKEFLYKQQRDLEQDEARRREFNAMNMGNTGVKMTDSECKKANELVPTTLAVSLNVKDHGNFGGTINFVLGIKTILHPVTSDEMIRNLVLGCKNSSKFFKFIKWTTGEIKFFKDFLLNVTEIRTDVLNTMSKRESGWWTSLKRRRQISDLKRRFGQGLMPNAAITLSMDEVQLIRSNYGYDLTDPKLVTKIMRDYFLLSFVIVDPSQEIALFLFDGEDHFQTMSFTGLERENNNSKNDFKEIYKLINSGRL